MTVKIKDTSETKDAFQCKGKALHTSFRLLMICFRAYWPSFSCWIIVIASHYHFIMSPVLFHPQRLFKFCLNFCFLFLDIFPFLALQLSNICNCEGSPFHSQSWCIIDFFSVLTVSGSQIPALLFRSIISQLFRCVSMERHSCTGKTVRCLPSTCTSYWRPAQKLVHRSVTRSIVVFVRLCSSTALVQQLIHAL